MPFLTANLLSRSYKFIFEFLLFLNFSFVIRISIFLLEYWFFLLAYSFFLLEYFPFSNWTLYSFLNFSLLITLKWNPLENNKTFYKSKYFEFWLELFPLLVFHDKFKARSHEKEFRSCFSLKGDNLSFFILLPSPSYVWKRQMSEVDSRLGGVK